MKVFLIEQDKQEREGFIPDEEPLYVPVEIEVEEEEKKLVPA